MPVALHLEVIVLPEKIMVELYILFQLFLLPGQDALRNLARQASRAGNDAFMVLLQKRMIDTRLVVKSLLALTERTQLDQIMVSLQVLGQQNQMVAAAFLPARLLEPALRRHIDLAAHNRLDARLGRRLHEFHHPVHIAMVGNGHRIHAKLGGFLHQSRNLGSAVQDRIQSMKM